jgi:S1-C subfamily serine protease/phage FluMu protein Com
MSIPVGCASCGSTLKVADQYAGRKGKCPKCGGVIQVPKIAQPIEPPAPAPKPAVAKSALDDLLASDPAVLTASAPAAAPLAPLSPARPAARPKSPSIPPWVWVMASGGVALVVLLLVVLIGGGSRSSGVATPPAQGTAGNVAAQPRPQPPTEPTPPAPQITLPPQQVAAPPATGNAPVEVVPEMAYVPIAKSMDEVTNAIVKFEMPVGGNQMSTGTGFLIDRRGWVATNNHVASMATTASRAKLITGQKIELEGIIAIVPERDLAIIKLKSMPPNFTLLDISYDGKPKIGTTVYTYGHPKNQDFSLAKGIVSRVLTTSELVSEQPGHLLTKINSPADALWIQTDATVLPGNSGGPLLDEQCHVLGINTFANLDAHFGFASHVKYLRELVEKSVDKAMPLKSPDAAAPPGQQITLSREKLQQTFDAAAAFGWKPANAEQYKTLSELALLLTVCKSPQAPRDLQNFAEQLFGKLREVPWSQEHFNAINQHAVAQLSAPNSGVAILGTMRGTGKNPAGQGDALVIEVPGVSDLLLVPAAGDILKTPANTRLLIFGMVAPQVGKAEIHGQLPRTVRFIQSHFILIVQ